MHLRETDGRLLCDKKKLNTADIHSSSSRPHGVEGGYLLISLGLPESVLIPSVVHHEKGDKENSDIRLPDHGSRGTFVTTKRGISGSFIPAGGGAALTSSILEPPGSATCLEVS